MAKTIMIQGTASGVGKTILTLALCRIFKQDGYKVAPFKAQNITSNTFITKKGEEISVSGYLQAVAAAMEPNADIAPLLLKSLPGGQGTQVIANGRYFDTANLYNFVDMEKLLPKVMEAYSRLYSEYEIIVIEGAGSPVELNLNKDDIVNMGMAKRANAPVILVSDIDRGGVFASLYGTINLLSESEKTYVKAMIVNRFRGEARSFKDGITILEQITGLPVAGVVPYTDFDLPEEDSFFNKSSQSGVLKSEPTGPHRSPATHLSREDFENQFNIIADTVRKALDMELVYKILHDGML